MKDDEAKLVNLKGIHRFFQSDLGKAMAASPLLLREYPFTILLPQGKALPAVEEGEEFLIQGVIDCVFQDGDDWILVDYKTDYLANEKPLWTDMHCNCSCIKELWHPSQENRASCVYIQFPFTSDHWYHIGGDYGYI